MTERLLSRLSRAKGKVTVRSKESVHEVTLSIESGRWVHFGHTGECEVEIVSLRSGSIAARVLCLGVFLVLDVEGSLSLHHAHLSFQVSEVGVNFQLDNCSEWRTSGEMPSLELVQEFLRSEFCALVYRELADNEPDIFFQGKDSDRFPGELLLSAFEVAVRKCFLQSADQHTELFHLLNIGLWYFHWSRLGFGLLEPLLREDGVKEVLVNSLDEVYVEDQMGLHRVDVSFQEQEHHSRFLESLAHQLGRRLDVAVPVIQGVLRGRFRVHVIGSQLCPRSAAVSVRCFPKHVYSLESVTQTIAGRKGSGPFFKGFLRDAVRKKQNILISGETSSGKTTLLEALSQFIEPSQRVVVVEDVRELRLRNVHSVYLQTRPAEVTGLPEYDLRSLVKESLRMRPDRIVIGECRGGEALDLLQALNTGHSGSFATVHGASALAALRRLGTLALFAGSGASREAINELLSGSIDLVVQMCRGRGGVRSVESVHRLVPSDAGNGGYFLEPVEPADSCL